MFWPMNSYEIPGKTAYTRIYFLKRCSQCSWFFHWNWPVTQACGSPYTHTFHSPPSQWVDLMGDNDTLRRDRRMLSTAVPAWTPYARPTAQLFHSIFVRMAPSVLSFHTPPPLHLKKRTSALFSSSSLGLSLHLKNLFWLCKWSSWALPSGLWNLDKFREF